MPWNKTPTPLPPKKKRAGGEVSKEVGGPNFFVKGAHRKTKPGRAYWGGEFFPPMEKKTPFQNIFFCFFSNFFMFFLTIFAPTFLLFFSFLLGFFLIFFSNFKFFCHKGGIPTF